MKLLITLFILLSLAACGRQAETSDAPTPTPVTETPSAPAQCPAGETYVGGVFNGSCEPTNPTNQPHLVCTNNGCVYE